MKILNFKKLLQNAREILSFGRHVVENRDLDEYEKVKKEFRPLKLRKIREAGDENKDISAI